MMNSSKIVLLAALAAMTVASPAFAKSVHHAARLGVHAFAMVPGSPGGSAFGPEATGGGSIGYNENLRRDTW